MNIIINDDKLQHSEIEHYRTKARALLFDDNDNVLIAYYGNVILLPGGSVEYGETVEEGILRELREETGMPYTIKELGKLNSIEYYQRDFPRTNNSKINRMVKTYYYVGRYKGVKKQELTKSEKEGNFRLELVPFAELEEKVMNNQNDNPRNRFFVKELLVVLNYYKQIQDICRLKKEL